MSIDKVFRAYENINPITQLAIKPALKAIDASNHPIRGGIAAALSSGVAHYAIFELIGQLLDNSDSQTGLTVTQLPIIVHMFVTMNMIANLGIGIERSFKSQKGA